MWLSDSPQLNEQSKTKIITKADKIRPNQCVTIEDDSFDQEMLDDGMIYFLNTQKLGKSSRLVSGGDSRTYPALYYCSGQPLPRDPSPLFAGTDRISARAPVVGLGGGQDISQSGGALQRRFGANTPCCAIMGAKLYENRHSI